MKQQTDSRLFPKGETAKRAERRDDKERSDGEEVASGAIGREERYLSET